MPQGAATSGSMTLWVPRARRLGFGKRKNLWNSTSDSGDGDEDMIGGFRAVRCAASWNILCIYDRTSRKDINSYGKSPSVPRLFKLIPILERRQFYNGTFWRPLQVLTALSLLYCHGMDERQSCRARHHFLTGEITLQYGLVGWLPN